MTWASQTYLLFVCQVCGNSHQNITYIKFSQLNKVKAHFNNLQIDYKRHKHMEKQNWLGPVLTLTPIHRESSPGAGPLSLYRSFFCSLTRRGSAFDSSLTNTAYFQELA